ncbi:hypothetical protein KPH14_002059 [Odynerus spinipes]|uniref:Uncharacterized protein n=1 Tax=Odynerus spinipes TaxID=1348599 RepID=A0AAD9REX5_9HYME|nr:hypothetical protein KPH14_002059 [Odynerus spinipes]
MNSDKKQQETTIEEWSDGKKTVWQKSGPELNKENLQASAKSDGASVMELKTKTNLDLRKMQPPECATRGALGDKALIIYFLIFKNKIFTNCY